MADYTGETSVMDNERSDTGDSFMISFFECEDGPYFEIDLTLPCNRIDSPLEANAESEEFDFGVSVSFPDESNITEYVGKFSTADDLFYRGQLLPLHQHLRLEMVKELEEGSETCSSSSWDSNQTCCGCDEFRCRSAETEEQTHFDSMVESATKMNVEVPKFGISNFSNVGMCDSDKSVPLPPPIAKPKVGIDDFDRCRSAETEEQTHFDSMVEPATKMNVEVPKSGFRKFSNVGMSDSDKSLPLPPPIAEPKMGIDDFDYSLSPPPPMEKPKPNSDYCPPLPPPRAKPLSFMMKFQCMKAAPLHLLTKDYSVRENPDTSFQNNKTNTNTSAKHAMQKYVRLVKRRICSQIHDTAHARDPQLKVDEGCLRPSIANESIIQTHGNFRPSGAENSLTSVESSPNIISGNVQTHGNFRHSGAESSLTSMKSSPNIISGNVQTHGNFTHSGAESRLTSMKSSPNIISRNVQTHGNFRHSGAESRLAYMKSSPNIFSGNNVQSAIDYCKHSNGVIGKTKLKI